MGRKRRTEKTDKSPIQDTVVEQPISELAAEISLTSEEKLDLLLTEAKIKNAELIKRLRTHEFNTQITNIRNDYDRFIAEVDKERISSQKYMVSLREAIEKRLNIKLEEYAYDDLTGKLTKL